MRVIIVGGGNYGRFIAEKFLNESHDIAIVDKDERCLRLLDETYDILTVHGSGASAEILLKAGIKDADMLLAMTDSDEVNIVACSVAKYYGVPQKIARITNDTERYFPSNTEEYLSRLGIDFIIDPERACAQEFYNLLTTSGITEKMDFANGRIMLEGFRVPKGHPLIGVPLKDIANRTIEEGRFVAFSRHGHIIIPRGEDAFCEGDEVFFMCPKDRVPMILEWLGIGRHMPESVVIVGGGRIGFYLAELLEKDKIQVKLIESNQERASMISEILSKTIVFRGDASDPSLLEELNLPDVDAFVAVTKDDEKNILSCVLTKQMLVKQTYCLVRKSEYVDILPTMMKINGVINTRKVVSSSILRFLRTNRIAAAAALKEIDAEVIEIIVDQDSKVLNKRISDLHFPRGAIIGAIIHNDDVIFARGDQRISLHDRLIIFYLPQAQGKIRSIFGRRLL